MKGPRAKTFVGRVGPLPEWTPRCLRLENHTQPGHGGADRLPYPIAPRTLRERDGDGLLPLRTCFKALDRSALGRLDDLGGHEGKDPMRLRYESRSKASWGNRGPAVGGYAQCAVRFDVKRLRDF